MRACERVDDMSKTDSSAAALKVAERVFSKMGTYKGLGALIVPDIAEEIDKEFSDVCKALRTVVRQMEGGYPVGHDAFLAARRAVRKLDAASQTSEG
jgi:hypothetical protein